MALILKVAKTRFVAFLRSANSIIHVLVMNSPLPGFVLFYMFGYGIARAEVLPSNSWGRKLMGHILSHVEIHLNHHITTVFMNSSNFISSVFYSYSFLMLT